jgi:hypothetical protein
MKFFNHDIRLFLLFSGVGFGTDSSIEGTLESELGQVQSTGRQAPLALGQVQSTGRQAPLAPMVYLSTIIAGISLHLCSL